MINSDVEMGVLIEHTVLTANYCVHYPNLDYLKETWDRFLVFWKPQELAKVRKYYGEKISMYVALIIMVNVSSFQLS